jgi:lysine-specific demethylase 8
MTVAAIPASPISLETLNAAGRRRYLALFFAEHLLGPRRAERLFGATQARNEARLRQHFAAWPRDHRVPVPEMQFTSHEDFLRAHGPSTDPIVFRGAAAQWPAVHKWDLDFFERELGNAECVMIDQVGLLSEEERGKYHISTLRQLVAAIRAGEKPYLRFSPLIKSHPALLGDLDVGWLRRFRTRFSLREEPQLFIGPASALTPLHCALESNLFIQVRGRKRWVCYPARYQPLLGVRAERLPYFHSGYSPDRPTPEFELARHAPAFETVLDAGDVMYIPPFVWHTVESLTPAVSVGYRFNALRLALRSSWPLTVARFLATKPSLLRTLYYSLTSTNFLYKPPHDESGEDVQKAEHVAEGVARATADP